jgi:hypothetical protein
MPAMKLTATTSQSSCELIENNSLTLKIQHAIYNKKEFMKIREKYRTNNLRSEVLGVAYFPRYLIDPDFDKKEAFPTTYFLSQISPC